MRLAVICVIILIELTAAEISEFPKMRNRPRYFNRIGDDRELVVMVAPSVRYRPTLFRENFLEIINFQLNFANMVREHTNVVILTDAQTLKYLDGRSSTTTFSIPNDAIIVTNISFPNIGDYSPLGIDLTARFKYRSTRLSPQIADAVDEEFDRFLQNKSIALDRREYSVFLDGSDVVDNGVDKALVHKNVGTINEDSMPQWAVMIKINSLYRKTVIVDFPLRDVGLKFNDVIAFVDDEVVVSPTLSDGVREGLQTQIFKKWKTNVALLELMDEIRPNEGNCGLHTAIFATNRFLYVPVFSRDPENVEHGHTPFKDKLALQMIETNSRRRVIPVAVPRRMCLSGHSMRSLMWLVRGSTADLLIRDARRYQ